jgi:hypothetical protein
MIVDTILSGALDLRESQQSIGPATLYDIYTDGKLAMETSKGYTRQLLSLTERKEFAQIVAYAMYKEGVLNITYSKIIEITKAYGDVAERIRSGFHDEEAFEFVANDVKLCGFLQRENDAFRFSHRSFMEFFLSRKMFLDLKSTATSDILEEDRTVSRDVLYVLGSLLQYDDRAYEIVLDKVRRLVSGREQPGALQAHNWIRALAFTHRPIAGVAGVEMRVEDVSVKTLNLFRLQLEGLAMSRIRAESIEMRESRIGRFTAEETQTAELAVCGGSVDFATLGPEIQCVRLIETRVRIGQAVKVIERCRGTKSEVSICCRNIEVVASEFNECTLRFLGDHRLDARGEDGPRFRNTRYTACRFENADDFAGIVSFDDCTFEKCYFDGIKVRGRDASAISHQHTSKLLGRCAGHLFVRNQGALIDPPSKMDSLLQKFEHNQQLKRDELETVDRLFRANVIRVDGGDLIVINVFYWSKYSKFVELVKNDHLTSMTRAKSSDLGPS